VPPKPLANSAPAGTSGPSSVDVFRRCLPARRFSLDSAPQQQPLIPPDDDVEEEESSDEEQKVFDLFDLLSTPMLGDWEDDSDDDEPWQKRRRNEE